ncbi:MAG: DnaD domain-containing protein [Firmicutes bacterium]|uniref:DNA replication protein n=1 Tax=Melghirimyces thermohalophilus TaxID=1236220 RepID=A0A1G6J6I7_9BACL|nr:DnaD domain-containing protein [Melghirimyces thermohalophilus]MDA8353091.1 DnaD domain-containing protein [Bacillota bacterium]SDC14320.1 DNA replication protein [Melghirimyces thermohalophilus]
MDRKMSPHSALVDVLQQGSTAFPVVLFKEYKRLGLNEGQVMLLLHIIVFREKEEIPFPTVNQLEERMSVSADQIVQWLQSLVQKGFLSIEETVEEGGIRSEQYSIAPLLQQLAASYLDRESLEEQPPAEETYGNLFQLFEREFARPLSPMECETLTQWLDEDKYPSQLIVAALREAVFCGKPSCRYIDRILLEWKRNGIQTVEEAVEYSRKFRQKGILYQPDRSGGEAGGSGFSLYNWVNQTP